MFPKLQTNQILLQALNELGETQNWPIEFVDGYIEKIHISLPWTSVFSESSQVEICGMKLTVQPKQRKEDGRYMVKILEPIMLKGCL